MMELLKSAGRALITMLLPKSKRVLLVAKRYFLREVVDKHYKLIAFDHVEVRRKTNQELIFMSNGFMKHGGLSDRLRGIISSFKYAKEHGMAFSIYWDTPFDLNVYLAPNHYDWGIDKKDVIYELPLSYPIYIGSVYKMCKKDKKEEEQTQIKIINDAVSSHPATLQFHVYSNAHFGDSEYHLLFHELFKPSAHLQRIIEESIQEMARGTYIAMTFRFLHLLSDFEDTCRSKSLSHHERELYVNQCIHAIKRIHQENAPLPVFVTSDSQVFLNRVTQLPFVFVARGKIAHIDYCDTGSYDKEFLDLYLLSRAKKIFRIHHGQMYYSGFPLTAGLIGNIDVVTLEI